MTWLLNTYGMEKVMDLYNNGQSEEDYEKLEKQARRAVIVMDSGFVSYGEEKEN